MGDRGVQLWDIDDIMSDNCGTMKWKKNRGKNPLINNTDYVVLYFSHE